MGRPVASRKLLLVIALQAVLLAALAGIAFTKNRAFLFYGLDGTFMTVVAQNQWRFADLARPLLDMNLIQANGNFWYPFKAGYVPGFLTSLWATGGTVEPVLCYTVFTLELFLATLALGLVLGFGIITASLGGWLAAAFVMPISALPLIYPITALAPHVVTLITGALAIAMLYAIIGRVGTLGSILATLLLPILTIWAMIASPPAFLLVAPTSGIVAAASLVASRDRAEWLWKIGAAVLVGGFLLLAGPAEFLAGLFRYTAGVFFWTDVARPHRWQEISILLQQERGWGGPILAAFGLTGGALAAFRSSGLGRITGVMVLVAAAALFAVGTLSVLAPGTWTGPEPVYLEFALWPLYAIYAAFLCTAVAGYGRSAVRRFHVGELRSYRTATAALVAAPVALAAGVSLLPARERGNYFPVPPRETELVAALAREAALEPGESFRGRAASIAGYTGKSSNAWLEQHGFDFRIVSATGNDHRLSGLPHFGIPILGEYSSFMTPSFFAVTSRYLTYPADRQLRGLSLITRPNISIMAALGVRFLLTENVLEGGATLRRSMQATEKDRLLLYELPAPNLGTFSPTRQITVTSASEALERIGAADLAAEVVAAEPLPERLVPAERISLSVIRGGLRLKAESAGHSAIVLPIDYSRCIEISGHHSAARLFRANLTQTGVLFSGTIDVEIGLAYGPFHSPRCRLRDADEMTAFGLGAIALPAR